MNFSISFKNRQIIYEQNLRCTVKAHEFNYSYNPTLKEDSSGTVKSFVTGSSFMPYVTTIGFYNDANDLLAVAKLAQPVPLSQKINTNFHVRFDI